MVFPRLSHRDLHFSMESSQPPRLDTRSRLPDKLITDNAHAESFAMSEDLLGDFP